jgi:hypothetical protein
MNELVKLIKFQSLLAENNNDMKSPGVLACGMSEKERQNRRMEWNGNGSMARQCLPTASPEQSTKSGSTAPFKNHSLSLSHSIKTTRNFCNILHN